MSNVPSTKAEAKAIGAKTYFTGKPCFRGHVTERYTSSYGCLGCIPKNNKISYYAHHEERKTRGLLWSKKNPEKNCERARRQRLKNPEVETARDVLKGVLRRLGLSKDGRTETILGYSVAELKEHLEKQFKPGMTWENRSAWHVDHKRSVSKMVKAGILDPKIINALANLQPLWAGENIAKGDSE